MDDLNISAPSGPQDNRKGISNTTIAVLLVLALTITIIGTWAVLVNVSTPDAPQRHNTNVAQVSLTIISNAPKQTQTVGKLMLNIENAG